MVHLRYLPVKSTFKIFFYYSRLHAIWYHLINHYLWEHDRYFLTRLISPLNRFFTGIELHFTAKISQIVFIDHEMGVVIGETTEISDDMLLYQELCLKEV